MPCLRLPSRGLPMLALVLLSAAPAGLTAADRVEFNRDIRPILSDNCFSCHGPDARKRKGELRLDVREDALRDRGGSAVLVPGKLQASELITRILSSDPAKMMPPRKANKTLTAAQKDLLKRWVAEGGQYQPHWAYIAPVRPALPAVKDPALVRTPVDAFVQEMLAKKDVRPAPQADKRTLVRRLYLDLLGLPPTPAEVEAFVNDPSPRAYESLVERLLQSPHYGERMAVGWLDLARYADTVGYHGDQNHNAWAYRDWVVQAFHDNMPFDRFTREQLAGDLLPNPTPAQLTATCFNRLNMMTREGGAQPKEYLARSSADRIRTVGMAWLGSTLACAECHDHKFDPFTMKDFYSLGAFFADVKQWGVYQDYGYTPNPDLRGWTNDHPWPPEIIVESPALLRRLARLEAAISGAAVPPADALAAWRAETRAYLKEYPDGWETPEPAVAVGTPTPPKPRKPAAKPAASKPAASKPAASKPAASKPAASKPAASKPAASKPAPAKPSDPPKPPGTGVKPAFSVGADGRVVLEPGPAAPVTLAVQPGLRRLAAVRVELLPDPRHGGRILRAGDSTAVRVSLALDRGGKVQPLAVRHAQADRAAPRYANGFEILGVQSAWLTDPKAADKPHTAVYFLDTPATLQDGDVLQVRLADSTVGCVRVSVSPLAPAIDQAAFPADLPRRLEDEPALARTTFLRSTAHDPQAFARVKSLEREVLECRGGRTPVMVTERTDKPLTIRVLARGNWMDESGKVCQPATPAFLPALPGAGDRPLTRLDLANWLCSPDNPLTARVFVNRLWRQFFGNGLAAVDDVGAQGESPSHPELLDWLAVEFRDKGWNVKHLVRLIVASHTYRQASGPRPELRDLDPSNRLLACQNPRRLEAEFVRDNALAITGLLARELGGPPCKPYQPAGYYEGLQFPDRDYVADRDERQYRRGLYTHWQRTFLQPMLANFDAPSREDCTAVRTAANSPQQALTMLNDPSFVEAARAWAARHLAAGAAGLPGRDEARLAAMIEEALARPPRPEERDSLLAALGRLRELYRQRPDDAKKLLGVGHAPAPGGDPAELAAWTGVARVLLNLHETITRY